MLDALTGFVVIGASILLGALIARARLLGTHGGDVLSRLNFSVLLPALLFTVLAQADLDALFSPVFAVAAIAAGAVIVVFALVARFGWKRTLGESLIGALSSGQVNSNNIGIPLSVYLLGSAAYPAPIVLMQLLVFTPVAVTILDVTTAGGRTAPRVLLRTLTNPIVIASLAGVLVSATGLALPRVVLEPVQLVANASVPLLLIAFGMSLHGRRLLGARGHRRDIVLASLLKLLIMPAVAWAAAALVFRLGSAEVLIAVVLAALPTAQNVFVFAQRYGVAVDVARDTVLITTIGSAPILLAATLLLHV